MKLVSFLRDQEVRLGFLLDNEILEPGLARSSLAPGEEPVFRDATSFIRAGKPAFKLASRLIEQRPRNALHPLEGAKLTAPMLPSTILCAGSNYCEHNDEKAGAPMSGKDPEFFIKTSDSVVGPGEGIRLR
jgi:2-keto-4-pentenoate hydratase/2-oxohepta-3-ene-1,7-dioic acid hydratase in catechol pathway